VAALPSLGAAARVQLLGVGEPGVEPHVADVVGGALALAGCKQLEQTS